MSRLFGLSWAHLLNDGAANYLPGVLPAVLASLDQPVRIAGVLVAAMAAGQALQPVTGWLADRLGGRTLVTLGLTMSSLGGALLGVAHQTWMLVVLLLMIGTGSAFFHPQALAGVRSMLVGKQGFLTSVFLVGGEIGRGIWPTVASLLVANLGLRGLWIAGLPGLITIPLLYRISPRLPAGSGPRHRIDWRRHARALPVLVAYRCIRAYTIYALVTFIPILWHVHGGSLVSGASIITTMTVVGVVGNLGGGHLSDRIGRRPVLVGSALSTAAFVLPVAYLHDAWVWIAAAPLGIALFLTASTTILIGQDIFPENRSMGSGIALGLANGIGALLVLVTGLWISDATIVVVFWIITILSAGSALLPWAFSSHLMLERPRVS